MVVLWSGEMHKLERQSSRGHDYDGNRVLGGQVHMGDVMGDVNHFHSGLFITIAPDYYKLTK